MKFLRGAGFGGASFLGSARFADATFSGPARFPGASFSGPAWFGGVKFLGSARFDESNFSGETGFSRAEFSGTARFSQARFEGPMQIGEANFSGDAHINGATFARAQRLGPLVVRGHLDLQEANFVGRLELEATASSLACVRTHFSDRVVFRLGGGHIALESVEFPVVAGVDLKACQFAGAHNLDKLRSEGANSFASTPEGWKRGPIVGYGPPLWRWTRRQTVAEEHRLRAERPRRWLGQRTPYPAPAAKQRDWYPPTSRPPDWLTTEELPPDYELINLYRSLRKAGEDGKDEPGAADFYYGEMELRRLADHTPWAERFILHHLLARVRYGLRGLRALIALATIILGVATLLYHAGFKGVSPSSNWWDSVLYATKATLSLPGTEQLTGWGEVLRIVLRLTGPVLLGLALLSVRNRVKR